MKRIHIRSAHTTRFGRLEDGWADITMSALRGAVDGIDLDRVCDVYVASYAPAELCGIPHPLEMVKERAAREYPLLRADFHGLFKTGGAALFAALSRMGAGGARGDVIVIGSEKMTGMNPARAAGLLAARENDHDRDYGATLPALGGLVTRAYLARHRIPHSALDIVSVKNHRNGARNPKAHFQREVSADDVARSPLVADPLRRLHCAPVSDGAACIVLSDVPADCAFIGWGKGLDTPLFQERTDPTRFIATARAAETARNMAGIECADINIVEIHDAFASFELINLEDMGFYAPGTAYQALLAGELDIGALRAVNPSGGKKAKGHPIGSTGVSSTVEIVEQLRGKAGPRQHPAARMGMIQSVGGVASDSYVFVVAPQS